MGEIDWFERSENCGKSLESASVECADGVDVFVGFTGGTMGYLGQKILSS